MLGKTVVVTGATSGIGEVASDRLAQKGARIVFVARDRERGQETLKHLRAIAGHDNHAVHYGDLTTIAEQKRVAAEIAASEPQIDVLINNAGAVFNQREVTADGLEKTFAVNHMAYFTMTNVLLGRLKATPGARIVSTASVAHRFGKLDFADLQSEKHYSAFRVYGTSKLCNILFTRELARRLAGTGVTANCQHPGGVKTRFGGNNSGLMAWVMQIGMGIVGITPEEGARTMIYLASSPDVEGKSGGYYDKSKLTAPSKEAQSDTDAKRLWDVSAQIAGVGL